MRYFGLRSSIFSAAKDIHIHKWANLFWHVPVDRFQDDLLRFRTPSLRFRSSSSQFGIGNLMPQVSPTPHVPLCLTWVRRRNEVPYSYSHRMFLIERCNDQSVFGNACTGGANRKKHFLVGAPVVQIAKTFLGPLHRWCKSQKPFWGRCTGGASISKNTLAVVWLP